jgi:D-alanyl-D-alanine carboxypeptidase
MSRRAGVRKCGFAGRGENALLGYATTERGEPVAFSILVGAILHDRPTQK